MSTRIYYFQPWAPDVNYGAEINHYCEMVRDPEAWICIADQDVMRFSALHPGDKLAELVDRYPGTGLFTVVTNRVANEFQIADWSLFNEDSIEKHYIRAATSKAAYTGEKETVLTTSPISGLVMIFRKSTWRRIGGFDNGLLHIDSQFSSKILKAGLSIRIIHSVYVLHYYRKVESGKAPFDKTEHLMK